MWWVAAAATCPVGADTVHLKNGRSLEGLIVAETERTLSLSIGPGQIELKKAAIQNIERSSPDAAEALEQQWSQRYLTHRKYAPAPYRDVAQSLRGVEDSERAAAAAHALVRSLRKEQPRLRAKLGRLEAALAEISRKLAEVSADENIEAYNRLVKENNRINADYLATRNAIRKNAEGIDRALGTISGYMRVFSQFDRLLDRRYAEYVASEANEAHDLFFEQVMERREHLSSRFLTSVIPFEDRGSHMVVEAQINDRGTVTLLLDTGASLVTLSKLAAERLQLPTTGKNLMNVQLADGSTVQAEPVILRSVQVGEARVEHVPAAVLPEPPHRDFEGLLGMSFLREFVLHYDATGRELLLKEYEPH